MISTSLERTSIDAAEWADTDSLCKPMAMAMQPARYAPRVGKITLFCFYVTFKYIAYIFLKKETEKNASIQMNYENKLNNACN